MGITDELKQEEEKEEQQRSEGYEEDYTYDPEDKESLEEPTHVIPAGTEVDFMIAEAITKRSIKDNPYVSIKAKILDTKYNHITIYHNFYLPYNRARLNRMILALRPVVGSISGKLSAHLVNRCAHGRIVYEINFNTHELSKNKYGDPVMRFGSLQDDIVKENAEFTVCTDEIIELVTQEKKQQDDLPF